MTTPEPHQRLAAGDRLAARLRAIRAQGGRSVRIFATQIGMAHSKVSRIENGQQMPNSEELHAWITGAVGADDESAAELRAELQAMLDDALTERSKNRRRFRDGQLGAQQEYAQLAEESPTIRTLQTVVVPALLQVPDYARALTATIPKLVEGADDVDAGVAARAERTRIVQDTSRRFEFIVWEPVFGRIYGSPAVMQSQLFHLGSMIGQPHVRFGVIPLRQQALLPDLTPFTLYGDVATIDHVVGAPRYVGTDAKFLHTYMDLLWEEAAEGDDARRLIVKAIDEVSS